MPQASTVSHLVFARARAGHSEQLGERLHRLVAPSRRTEGCLEFALQQSLHDPELWLISGAWATEQAMNAWFRAPELEVFSELLQSLLISSLDFHTFATPQTLETGATPALRAV